jgi:CSLREA domain-containing protein
MSSVPRIALGAALLMALAAAAAVLASQRADAGAVAKLTVNSTSNTDDGQCNGPPNDQAVGNCTLREAIEQVNDGLADTINFHPTVFSKASPGVIQLDLGEGELPPIEREVTIDNNGTAVVLDCNAENDGNWQCDDGLIVRPTHNAFDFTRQAVRDP